MDKNKPLITVILPTYRRNYDDFLKNAIESVLSQTYENFEFFIVDDGSQDGSSDLIQQFAEADHRIQYMRFDKNLGLPAYVILQAYLKSKGQYIAFIFDDCMWRPDHLACSMSHLLSDKKIFCTYSKCEMHSKHSVSILGKPFDQADLERGLNFIPNVSVVLHRKVIEDIGWYDPHVILKRSCDLDLWIRISQKYTFYFIDQVTTDEYGVMLDDSLGNSVGIDLELLTDYMHEDRNHRLLPLNIKLEDSYQYNAKNDDENMRFKKLLIDHFMKSVDIEKLLSFDITFDSIEKKIATVKNQHLSSDHIHLLMLFKQLLDEEKKKTNQAIQNHRIALMVADHRWAHIEKLENQRLFKIINKLSFKKK